MHVIAVHVADFDANGAPVEALSAPLTKENHGAALATWCVECILETPANCAERMSMPCTPASNEYE